MTLVRRTTQLVAIAAIAAIGVFLALEASDLDGNGVLAHQRYAGNAGSPIDQLENAAGPSGKTAATLSINCCIGSPVSTTAFHGWVFPPEGLR